jgi:putative Mg2+ transporter-C (MgtC) family protein
MPTELTWQAAALRLALTVAAGMIIGINRGERGHVAGLRTVLLVSVAACVSMLQVNALLSLQGRSQTSFIMMDLMRLPLGVLSGMGFIGAGAILRRGSAILGVTTAATLWLMTIVGLCFGGGQLALGGVGTAIAGLALWAMKRFDEKLPRDRRAAVVVEARKAEGLDERIRATLTGAGFDASYHSGVYGDGAGVELHYVVRWRGASVHAEPTALLAQLSACPGVESVRWNVEDTEVEERK